MMMPLSSASAMVANTSHSASRDRSAEFSSIVNALQGQALHRGQHAGQHSAGAKSELARQSAEFMTIARSIGLDIASTYGKLEKLTQLARRKTLFDDRPLEIEQLTQIIKEDMGALNRQIGQLQQIAKAQQKALKPSRHQVSHSSGVVVSLQSRLASMTNDFKRVLEVRTRNLKESKCRQDKFSHGSSTPTSLPIAARNGYPKGSVLALAAMDDERGGDESQALLPQQSGLMFQQDVTDEYLQSRANTMQNIESTIVELGGIFQQLGQMIKEQEEVVIRIDSNVEDAALNVERGHAEILKYFQSVTSNRWLMVKTFAVLIFFLILFIVFLA